METRDGTRDVAEPDEIVSGMAGTGQENAELEWGRRHIGPDPYMAERKTEILGTGFTVRHKKKPKTVKQEEPKSGCAFGERPGEMFFILAERQERIRDYLRKKIDKLDQRITALEEKERSR